jgi:hypothetical protein
MLRNHFKLVYARSEQDLEIHLQAGSVIFEEVKKRFGPDLVRRDTYTGKKGAIDFPVLTREDEFISSLQMSETLQKLPIIKLDATYVDRSIAEEVGQWLKKDRNKVLESAPKPKEDE